MHSLLAQIVCTSSIKLIIFSSLKRTRSFLLLFTPHSCPCLCHSATHESWKTNYERVWWVSRNSKSSATNIHIDFLRPGKALYSPGWQIRYLIIAFEYKHWSKPRSLLRKHSSSSGRPITNKQFHFLPITTPPRPQLLLVIDHRLRLLCAKNFV